MAVPLSGNPHGPPPLCLQMGQPGTSSAPSSATIPNPLTPGGGINISGPTTRPSSGPRTLQSQHTPFSPGSAPRSVGYMHSFQPSVAPPGAAIPGYTDYGHPHGSFGSVSGVGQSVQMTAAIIQGQKRAYRQRRKDPSCDACRERKVKCDATDSSSCTECSSRNVKCQFTKETNRRMSNIRHNQDLQKELAQAKSQVNQLRSILESGADPSEAQHLSAEHLPSPDASCFPNHNLSHLPGPEATHVKSIEQVPLYEPRHSKRRRTASSIDVIRIGSNMERQGRGIFKPPYPNEKALSPISSPRNLPALPSRDIADALIHQYHATLHPALPLIHWPAFKEQYEAVYKAGSLEIVPVIWVALLYAVFACGNLHRSHHDSETYMGISRSLIDLCAEDLTLDHARTALLNSISLVEMNRKSAGWIWLGFAIRISFDLGLHCEAGTWSAIETEMRRRVWWCMYTCDCLLSLELGRPATIKEEDCNVEMPSPVDDQYMHSDDSWLSPTPEQSVSPLLPTIQVVGGIARLLRLFKSRHLAQPALEAYESHFKGCVQGFPVYKQIRANNYVDPVELPAIMYLQNARLMLHRHNLTPSSDATDRSLALDHCASTASDTAELLRRCMQETPPECQPESTTQNNTWEDRMVSAASSFLCTHIWRCTLFLTFRLNFEHALWCARASATLGDSRPVNVACGRYLEFFLKEMVSKMNQGVHFDTDEEIIAYVSGDLQGSLENSWIWKDSKEKIAFGNALRSPTLIAKEKDNLATDPAESVWGGWGSILSMLEGLLQEKQQAEQKRAIEEASLRPPMILPPLAPSPNPANPSNRMSIKDLI